MEQNRVRIVDIAEELGLSTATVSNVIHGKTKKLSRETVKRVQELLEKGNIFQAWRAFCCHKTIRASWVLS